MAGCKAAFTPAQHVARQHHVARNMFLVAVNKIVARTSNMLQATSNLLPRNMLRWCKRGLTASAHGEQKRECTNGPDQND